MEFYSRSQFGRFLALLFLIGLLLSAAAALMPDGKDTQGNALLAVALLAACFTLTYMNVRVTHSEVEIRLGVGFPRKRVPLSAIAHVGETRIP